MTLPAVPGWFEQLQHHFGQMLRAPLDPRTGTLSAAPETYPSALLRESLAGPRHSTAERLATYNRQYWFRLFSVLQGAYPLTTHLCGHFRFNEFASKFLTAHPPRGWDIDRVADGFDDFLASLIDEGRSERGAALVEAAHIDGAFLRVFAAPSGEPCVLGALEPARLLRCQLELSPAAALVTESWPLCEMRRELRARTDETPAPLPPRLAAPRTWLLLRRQSDLGLLPLEPREALLLLLLTRHALQEALARLEATCSEAERASLPAATRRWLERSMTLGLWSGFSEVNSGV